MDQEERKNIRKLEKAAIGVVGYHKQEKVHWERKAKLTKIWSWLMFSEQKKKKLYKEDKDNYAIKVISVFDRKS